MQQRTTPIREYPGLDVEAIRRDVIAVGRPAVLRGLVAKWPAVMRGRRSADAFVDYLRGFDTGSLVDAIMMPPEAGGRVDYNPAMDGFNFIRNRLTLSAVAEQVLRYSRFPNPPAVAVQSAPVLDCVPRFGDANVLDVVDAAVPPRIWLGNAITTPTHLDEWCNLACAVVGRRRFTLFPPEQVPNLYVGPLDFAPTGAPISLVHVATPDFDRFPRFRTALAAAVTADLGPGDALYIPPLWWHNVESLEPFNVLVNYWWHAGGEVVRQGADSGFDSLLHGILNLRNLPEPTRAAWLALFEHYVFGPAESSTAHIPPERRGVLGSMSPASAALVRAYLARRLEPPVAS